MKKTLFTLAFAIAAISLPAFADGTTYYVDKSATAAATHDGLDPSTAFLTIQEGLDAASAGDTVVVAEGDYDETAPNKMVDGASYQFGLFFGTPNVTLKAADGAVVTVTTNATNNFGPSGIFVAADNVTIDGITIGTNSGSTNKTIEVIADGFTLKNSTITDPEGALYISDFSNDSKVNTYTITGNIFEDGSGITLASGAGSSTPEMLEQRQITNNTFNGSSSDYARISFSGNGGQPWYVYPVGGAIISGNKFTADNKWDIRARGGYDNDQFNWSDIWENNTFSGATVALSDTDAFALRDYAYASYSNVRSIGSNLDWAVSNASSSDTVLIQGTTTVTSTINLNKAITIKGVNGGAISTNGGNNIFLITSSDVTIEGLDIAKTDKTTQQLLAIQSGNNISIKNNTIHGQFVIGEGDVARAMVVSAGLQNLTIDGNTIYSLRQPAYVSGTTTGTVSNNFVYGTKGWVLENGDLTFTGNTWGTGVDANVFDIAIIPNVATNFYTDIVAMANANHDAVIEDQRMSPRKLSVAYVQSGTSHSTDMGGRYHPYATIDAANGRVVDGGKVIVYASSLAITPETSTTSVTLTVPMNVENNFATTTGNVKLEIATGTVITGAATWDGIFKLLTGTTTATLPYERNGFWLTMTDMVEMGADTPLTFDKAMKITFTGHAGEHAGWAQNGVFTEITAMCDSTMSPTLAAGADCKVDDGADLVIFTKHATTFMTYTQVNIPYGGGGGSTSTGGSGSVGQVLGASTSTVSTTGTTTSPIVVVSVSTSTGQVLGVSKYTFTRNLGFGSRGADVTELQKALAAEGFFVYPEFTTYFGPVTKAALVQWQKIHGIPSTGFFGIISRTFINK